MKKILFIFLLSGFVFPGFTQEKSGSTLQQANELYAGGEYLQAAHIYEEIIKNEGVAPEVYYNLGNAYYKANEIGLSILNYERALRLNPHYEDAKYNLQLAQTKVIDNITESESFFVKRWFNNLISSLTSNQWLYLSWGLFLLCLIGFVLFVFASSRPLRKVSFNLAIIFVIIAAFSLFFSISRKGQFINHNEAVIMVGIVTVKSSPDKSGTELFELHEGTKVNIKSSLGDWTEIVIGDGRTGWVEKKNMEQI